MTAQNTAEAGNDAQALDDRLGGCEAPLFYSLPQSVQDDLVAHFMALSGDPFGRRDDGARHDIDARMVA